MTITGPVASERGIEYAWEGTTAERDRLREALTPLLEAAEAVDREWRERGDGGCTTELRLALSAAIAHAATSSSSRPSSPPATVGNGGGR